MEKKKFKFSGSSISSLYSDTKVSFVYMILAIVTGVIGVMSLKGDGINVAINYAIGILGVALVLFSVDFLSVKKAIKIVLQLLSLTLGIVLLCIALGFCFAWFGL